MQKIIIIIVINIFSTLLSIYTVDISSDSIKPTSIKIFTLYKNESLIGDVYFLSLKKEINHEKIAYKINKNNEWYYTIEGKKYGPYLSMDNFKYSDDGTNWGFSAAEKDYYNWSVIFKSVRYGPYKYASSPQFSSDGRSFGFKAQKDDGDYLIINGKEFGPFMKVTFPAISKEKGNWAYSYLKDTGWFVRLSTGKEFGPYDFPVSCVFNKNGSIYGFRVVNKSKNYIIINGKKYGPFDLIPEFYLSEKSWGFQYKTKKGLFYLINNKKSGNFSQLSPLYFNTTGTSWGFNGFLEKQHQWYIFFDDKKKYGPYNDKYKIYFNENGEECSIWRIEEQDNTAFININEEQYGPFEYVFEPTFDITAKLWIFCSKKKKGIFIIKNGKEDGPFRYDDVESFYATDDLNNWCFIGEKNNIKYAVINGKEYDSNVISLSYFKNEDKRIFYWIFKRDKNIYLSKTIF